MFILIHSPLFSWEHFWKLLIFTDFNAHLTANANKQLCGSLNRVANIKMTVQTDLVEFQKRSAIHYLKLNSEKQKNKNKKKNEMFGYACSIFFYVWLHLIDIMLNVWLRLLWLASCFKNTASCLYTACSLCFLDHSWHKENICTMVIMYIYVWSKWWMYSYHFKIRCVVSASVHVKTFISNI